LSAAFGTGVDLQTLYFGGDGLGLREAAMKKIVCSAIILFLTSSSASAEWKYHLIEHITSETQGQATDESERFINNDCKPNNWEDFSGFITQPGLEGQPYSLHLLCRTGDGKAGRVIVKVAFWHGPDDFLHTIDGFAKVTVLGMSLSQTANRNSIYFAVPE
jgi:hypothetical protein